MFKDLPHRTRFNKRRKQLHLLTQNILNLLSDHIEDNDKYLIIDSMPLPTCKIVRERTSKACRREQEDELVASKGYNAMFNGYYIGYKFHLIVSSTGVYKDHLITPANIHDTAFLKDISAEDVHLQDYVLLGDYELKIKRKKIETVFAQFCDEFMIRRNYAKRFNGFEIRLITKIASKTLKQLINFRNGNPINQTKHSLAA